jgi:hypothetical protein
MEVTELFLVLRALWFRIQHQILVLRNVDVANNLGEELQYLQIQMLGVLQARLQELTTKIEKLANASLLRRCVDPDAAVATEIFKWIWSLPSQQKSHIRDIHERLVERVDQRSRDLV